jgi:ABC-type nitrate/sulfonate/bicarbonate transport system substrate-binding protein
VLPNSASAGGIFKKHGLDLDILYTAAGPESIQAVIGGSIDIAAASGVSAAIGTFAKGAPIRIISSEMTGAPDLYWYRSGGFPDQHDRGFQRQDGRLFADRVVKSRLAVGADRTGAPDR